MDVKMTLNNREVNDLKEFKKFKLLFCGIFIFVGTVFSIISLMTFKTYSHKSEVCTYRVSGTVTDIIRKESTDSDGDRTVSYYPVFTYSVGDATYIKEYNYTSSNSSYHIGQGVSILLDPNNYDEYLIEGDKSEMTFCIIFGGIGSVLLLVGVLVAIFMKYKSQEEINEETDEYIRENTISRDQFETEYKDDGDSPFVK